jgi:hypothetical protein
MNRKRAFEKTEYKRFFMGIRILPETKIIFSIISTFVWLGFNLYWIAFQWTSHTGFQNIALLAISFLVFSASNAILWVSD